MALDPDILFFDEPSAGLDPIRSRRLDELILAVRDSLGATVVVTHELSRRMGDALRFPLLPPVWRKIVGVVVFSRGQFLSEKRLFVLFLEGSVKGLNIGAPVDFQGVQIGSVTDIRLHYIAEDHEFRTPVFIELEPARITEVGVRDAAVDAEIKEHGLCKTSIDRGLRAQLATQSLVIGQLFVQMVFHPDTPVRLVGGESKVLELPTIPTTLQQASQEAQELLKKLGELPLDQLFANVLGITQGLNRLVNAPETQALVHVLSRTTTDVQELVRHLQGGPQLAGGHPAVGKEEEGVMQRKTIALFMGGALVVFSATIALSAEQAHWGYSGNVGPEHWGTLAPAYELCARGRNQSPIDLTGFVRADLQPIKVRYRTTAQEIHNTGHSLQANYTPGSTIELDGHVFELKQFHFHAPSENRISSKIFPLEGHLVHADSGGNLAVVAVMFVEGKANTTVAALWKQMPTKEGEKVALTSQVNAAGLLPKNRAYYRYNGSLTTPPCSEGVWWLVLKEPVSVSRQQVEAFTTVMGHPNNRPVQALNARPILQPRSK